MTSITTRAATVAAPSRTVAASLLVGMALLLCAGAVVLAFDLAGPLPHELPSGLLIFDPAARLFALCVNLIFLGITVHVWTRAQATSPAAMWRYAGAAALFVGFCNLAIFSGHLVGYWISLEATTLAAVPLIQHEGGERAMRASWRYFVVSVVGLGLALVGSACLARYAEHATFTHLTVDSVSEHGAIWRRLGLGLMLLGLGTKLGLAPMYAWLPETYDAAPPGTTAMLAAVQFNVALVGVLRLVGACRVTDAATISLVLVSLGLMTMAVSALGMITTQSYKRLIAYASLNHAGVLAVGLGVGRGAAYGVVLYAVSNAFIKAVLFLTAGKIREHYDTDDVGQVSGVIKEMPSSGIFLMVGTFALLGLPPFGSFVGELLIMSGLLRGGYFAVFALFGAMLTVTFVATGRSMFPMIWGEAKRPRRGASQPLWQLLPKLSFVAALVALGLYVPAPLEALFRGAASLLGGQP